MEMDKENRNQDVFNSNVQMFKTHLKEYANSLIAKFGSNKKARAFLRSQLFTNTDPEVHEFIKIMVTKLEQIALNQ